MVNSNGTAISQEADSSEFVLNGRDIAFSTGMELPQQIGNQGGNCERHNDGLHSCGMGLGRVQWCCE